MAKRRKSGLPSSDQTRLGHMLDAIEEALRFIRGRKTKNPETDRMLLLALVKEIEILGESASRVSQETREQLSEIPWTALIHTRNRLIHGYCVDATIIWRTIKEDFPLLRKTLRRNVR